MQGLLNTSPSWLVVKSTVYISHAFVVSTWIRTCKCPAVLFNGSLYSLCYSIDTVYLTERGYHVNGWVSLHSSYDVTLACMDVSWWRNLLTRPFCLKSSEHAVQCVYTSRRFIPATSYCFVSLLTVIVTIIIVMVVINRVNDCAGRN